MDMQNEKIDPFEWHRFDEQENTEEVARDFLAKLQEIDLDNISKMSNYEALARREAINHPPHYNQGQIEVIDVIEDWGLDFHAGNVIKYVARHKHKGNSLEDLKKARFYLDRLIEGLENGSNQN